jgi:hypothetical protein
VQTNNYSNSKSCSFLPLVHQLTTFWWPWDKQSFIFESCHDLNRCTSCKRNLIHMTHTCPWQAVHDNLSPWLNRVGQIHWSQKKCSWHDPQPSWLVCGSCHSFSLLRAIEAVSLMNMLHRYTRPISLACDQYIQYLLTVIIDGEKNKLGWLTIVPRWRCSLRDSRC